MMGDSLHDIPGWSITDNGDGHARIALTAEPNAAIYPSFAELDALMAWARTACVRSPGFAWRLVEQPALDDLATESIFEAHLEGMDCGRRPCASCAPENEPALEAS